MTFSGIEWKRVKQKESRKQNKMECSRVEWNDILQNRIGYNEMRWDGKDGRVGWVGGVKWNGMR